ncbi:hypothetical protein [Bacillus halotolerans]|uniref:hypothetical protein n=1 Tax=Bacillus halotolerans TaxID=260554 RepID=UPI003D23EFA0
MNQGYSTVTPISEGFILQFADWSTVFIVLPGIGCFYFCHGSDRIACPPEKRTKGRLRETLITFRHLLGGRAFMGFAFSQAFIGTGMFAYISGSPFILQNIYGVCRLRCSACHLPSTALAGVAWEENAWPMALSIFGFDVLAILFYVFLVRRNA